MAIIELARNAVYKQLSEGSEERLDLALQKEQDVRLPTINHIPENERQLSHYLLSGRRVIIGYFTAGWCALAAMFQPNKQAYEQEKSWALTRFSI